jgi:HEAT repeat protein
VTYRWLIVVGVVLLLAGAAVLFEPSGVLYGTLTGESFFQGRPASAWGRRLRDTTPGVREEAQRALQEGGAAAVPVLVALLAGRAGSDWTTAEQRWSAAEVLGKIGAPADAATPDLVRALADPDPHVRTVALKSLETVGVGRPESVAALIELLHGDECATAARVLSFARAEASDAVPPLVDLLDHKEANVRWNAARTLGKIGPGAKTAVPALVVRLREDSDPAVREHAAEALGDIGPDAKEGVPALVQALRDENAKVRRDSARSLGQIGPAARAAVAALNDRLKDEEKMVRDAAEKSLRQIAAAAP